MTSLVRHSRLTYYDLGSNCLTQGVELLPEEVWQVSKRNSQYFRSHSRKKHMGAFAPPPPPVGRGLMQHFVKRSEILYLSILYLFHVSSLGYICSLICLMLRFRVTQFGLICFRRRLQLTMAALCVLFVLVWTAGVTSGQGQLLDNDLHYELDDGKNNSSVMDTWAPAG